MKNRGKKGIHRPFKHLKALLEANSVPISTYPTEKIFYNKKTIDEKDDTALFKAAMADVTPLPRDNKIHFGISYKSSGKRYTCEENEMVQRHLKDLVEYGRGFVVEHTSGYIEWVGPKVCSEISRRLHEGQFSIQSYIDFHGFTVSAAKEVFENFLKDSITTGKRGVLIIHGRGLSSPKEPVLKTNVYEWLSRGPWRKWIIAFTSARSCDGGTGATYVLLRRHPLTKRHLKKISPVGRKK
jgi:DNA-nicking Smr family endonuclease